MSGGGPPSAEGAREHSDDGDAREHSHAARARDDSHAAHSSVPSSTERRLPRPAHFGLVLLAVRRVLTPALFVIAVPLACLFAFGGGPSDLALVGPTSAERLAATRRADAWTGLGLCALPAALFASAAFGRRWRAGDRLWLGTRPLSRAAIATSAWLGSWAGAAALAAGVALVAEVAAGEAASAPRVLRQVPAPRALLVEGDERAAWSVSDPAGELAPGRLLRLTLATAPGSGPAARVRFRCARGDQSSESEALVHGRMTIDVALPRAASEDVVLTLERLGPGCAVILSPDSLALLDPSANARRASAELFLRAALFLGAWTALAQGFGAWMRPSAALALALALALPAWSLGRATPFLPGCDLPTALGEASMGLVPRALALAPALAGLALFACAGLLLATRGLDASPADDGCDDPLDPQSG